MKPGYCNFSKAVTTLKFKPAQIKINLIHSLINLCHYNTNELL